MTQESVEAKVGTKRPRPDSDTKPSTNDERTESNNQADVDASEATKRQKTESQEPIVQVRDTQEPIASQGWTQSQDTKLEKTQEVNTQQTFNEPEPSQENQDAEMKEEKNSESSPL